MHDLNRRFVLVIGARVNIGRAIAGTLAALHAAAKRRVVQCTLNRLKESNQ